MILLKTEGAWWLGSWGCGRVGGFVMGGGGSWVQTFAEKLLLLWFYTRNLLKKMYSNGKNPSLQFSQKSNFFTQNKLLSMFKKNET